MEKLLNIGIIQAIVDSNLAWSDTPQMDVYEANAIWRQITGGEKIRYGLHLPHFVLVRSTIEPIIGSLIASQTLATAKITPSAKAGRHITL